MIKLWKTLSIDITLLSPVAAYIIYRMYLPIRNVINTLNRGEMPDDQSYNKARKALVIIPGFLFILGAFSYLAGIGMNYTMSILGKNPMKPDILISRIIIALIWGMLNGFITARILNIFLIQAKLQLKIFIFGKSIRGEIKENILGRLFIPLFVLFLFAIVTSQITNYHHNKEILKTSENQVAGIFQKINNGEISAENSSGIENNVLENMRHINMDKLKLDIFLASFFIFFLALLLFIILLETRSYVNNLSYQIKNMTGGKLDLTKRINITSFDDIGEITNGINTIIDNLSRTFQEIKKTTTKVYESGEIMQKTITDSQNSATNMNNLIIEVEQNINNQIKEIRRSSFSTICFPKSRLP